MKVGTRLASLWLGVGVVVGGCGGAPATGPITSCLHKAGFRTTVTRGFERVEKHLSAVIDVYVAGHDESPRQGAVNIDTYDSASAVKRDFYGYTFGNPHSWKTVLAKDRILYQSRLHRTDDPEQSIERCAGVRNVGASTSP